MVLIDIIEGWRGCYADDWHCRLFVVWERLISFARFEVLIVVLMKILSLLRCDVLLAGK